MEVGSCGGAPPRVMCRPMHPTTIRRLILLAVMAGVVPAAAWQSGDRRAGLRDVLDATSFRNIGPFRTGAWITEIAVPESPLRDHLYTIYAATRTGGLWKTTNNGMTWEPISDSVDVAAVGAVALAPSNPAIVWMGTGDQANARSSYSGQGVFKSTDAGRTWQLMGLPDSHHIARIVVHPTNPDIVYVAAMGHLFSRNEERGVFRTRNGGKTWEKVLYVDDGTGAIDLVINRQAPATLYAAMYEKHRTPWQLTLGGPGSAVYRSDDGGTTWQKVSGLPAGNVGRIGLDIHRRNPKLLTAIVENLNSRSEGMPARADACAGQAGWSRRRSRRWTARQRGLSQRGRRPHLEEDARRRPRRRRLEGPVLVQPDQGQPGRSEPHHREQRHDVRVEGRRADLELPVLPRRVRRFPDDVVGRSGSGAHHDRQRRRRERLGGRWPHRRLLPEQARRRGVCGRRRHGRSVQRLRWTAGPRLVEGAEQRQERARSRWRTGRRSAPATGCTTRSTPPTRAGSTTPSRPAGSGASIRQPVRRSTSSRRARRVRPRCATTGSRRSSSLRTTRRSSIPARRCCFDRSIAATCGRRSARTSQRATRRGAASTPATCRIARSRRLRSRRSLRG